MSKEKINLRETIILSEAAAERIADDIAGLLIAEKETIMDALQNDDEQALADEIYYALRG